MVVDLTISIVSGSQPDLTIDCLRSLTESLDARLVCEIFLVDNASPTKVGQQAYSLFPHLNLIRNHERKGFAANHNQVLRQCSGRFVLLLNDDTIVLNDACQRMVVAGDENQTVGFFGARLLNPDLTLQRSAHRFPSPARAFVESFCANSLGRIFPWFDDYSNWSHEEKRKVEFLSGAALMIRRESIDAAGLLDERFFMYAEEADWCLRGKRAGWETMFVPDARFIHYGGQSSIGLSAERSVEFLRSHEYFIRKHHGTIGLTMYKLFVFIKHMPRLTVALLFPSWRNRGRTELDIVAWSLGMLNRPGLGDLSQRI
ncbi:MAG TPA: glycosyltransferase family 2 protein [Candidatus Obscuribacterales bacterium]